MQTRRLGRTSIETAPLIFGGNIFGWTVDEAASFTLLDAWLAAGFNAIDTADVYSRWVPGHRGGESETVIGNWLKSRGGRDKVVIFTKVGFQMGSGDKGLAKDWIIKEVEASLRRLQTDYIDLYQAHTDDETVPLEETLATFATLIEQGKVRAIGASNYTAPRLKAALDTSARLGLPRYETLQPLYNLFDRGFEAELAPLCASEGIGVINYYPLASGFLSGKYRSEADLGKSARGAGVKKYLTDRGLRILAALDRASDELGATPAQVAVAWVIAQPAITAPIASATNLDQLADLRKAADLTLSEKIIADLNKL
jgi:aryl-alcohol dehydrogenase-like predicted oxidoreductase